MGASCADSAGTQEKAEEAGSEDGFMVECGGMRRTKRLVSLGNDRRGRWSSNALDHEWRMRISTAGEAVGRREGEEVRRGRCRTVVLVRLWLSDYGYGGR